MLIKTRKPTIGVIRIVIVIGSVIIYFKKRKLYVDDKSFKIKILPKKTISIYRKDIFNIIGIIGSSTLFVSIGEKVYFFVKEHDIMLTISKKLAPTDIIDVDTISSPDSVSSESIEVLSLAETKSAKPKK